LISIGESGKKFKEKIFFADPQFFEMFDFKWLSGNPGIILTDPGNVALTRESAEKFFGKWEEALGKTIKYENRDEFKVAAILENVPANSDFPLNIIFSYKSFHNPNLNDWVSTFSNHYCFVLLPAGAQAAQFDQLLPDFVKRHKPPEYIKDGLKLQALGEMHFDSRFSNYTERTFSRELITALSVIGIFILIIACVNFINLSTARAVNRAREVGIRKVIGGNRIQLIIQFLSETALISSFAVIIGAVIVELFLPALNRFLEISIKLQIFTDPEITAALSAILFFVILFSGLYPAFVLSAFNPAATLKFKTDKRRLGGISLRRGLVIFQFIIAQFLVICMIVVVSQMNYFRNASLGFDKEAVLLVPVPEDSVSHSKINYLKEQFRRQPGIKNVTASIYTPADDSHWSSDFKFDKSVRSTDFGADLKWADADYFNFYNLKLVAGRFYTESDTVREFVINETLLKKLGLKNPGDAIGKEINFWEGEHIGSIVGVVKDFHTSSLHKQINPAMMSSWLDVYNLISIKIETGNIKETLASIEKLWKQVYPDYIYDSQFLDEKIDNFYRKEEQLSDLYEIFAAIAVFISCMGLYGLVSFMAVQRTKEVGIRKVLGASPASIVFLFSKEFTILIIAAFLIAAPISVYVMHSWLENFAFRISLNIWLFIAAVFGSLAVAWITVGYHSIKAAAANPVKSLRYE
jgi:ABC-type antimicrobial peptide transport system permease subunit